ncbi:hypothetical protein RFI_12450, partial [Reticulomyxa filosa]
MIAEEKKNYLPSHNEQQLNLICDMQLLNTIKIFLIIYTLNKLKQQKKEMGQIKEYFFFFCNGVGFLGWGGQLSLGWWLQHFADAYNANPLHMVTELILVVVVVWLLFKGERSSSRRKEKLTTREQQELIDEWQPEPLVPDQMNTWSREPVHLHRYVY